MKLSTTFLVSTKLAVAHKQWWQRTVNSAPRRENLLSARTSIAVLLATLALVPARADSPTEDLLNDRFVIDVGGFVVTSTINGSLLGSANTSEQSIDFNKEFGTDADQTRWRAEFLWRITPTQHVRFSYFDNDVGRTRTIDQDLPWGDYTFKVGGQVAAETKFRVYELDYEFAFLRRPNYEIVAIAGIHLDDLTLKLSGNASLTVDTPTGPVEETATYTSTSHSIPAPLPVLGFRGDWAVSPHVYLDASGEIFSISYQGIDGNWSELRAGATWMFSDHFGVGIGYDRFATHVDVGKASFNGRLNWGYQGLLLYLRGGF
jgi:hypothetical protein